MSSPFSIVPIFGSDPSTPNRLSEELSRAGFEACRRAGTLGTFFGYPRCCQNFFDTLRRKDFVPNDKEENLGFTGTGLRVCPRCCEKTFLTLYKRIRSNRFCARPFPIDHRDDLDNLSTFDTNFLIRVVKEYESAGEDPPLEVKELIAHQQITSDKK